MNTKTAPTAPALAPLPADVARELAAIVADHDRHKGCYFWTPRTNASSRRAAEFSRDLTFQVGPRTYSVEQSHTESCKNVYYRLAVAVDGHRSNVAALRKLLAAAN